jgi:general secretion pathway protein K
MRRTSFRRTRQRGVAVVTALMLTTLAITIVASLFWQQQVQVRLIENQRLQLQKQWVLRGALDWARLILREDARLSNVDHLGEPWAVPLAPTRLDQYVENETVDGDVGGALLSGGVIDAQSRFNLTNLALQGEVSLDEVKAFKRLLANLQVDEQIAEPVANAVAASQIRPQLANPGQAAAGAPAASPTTPSMPLIQVDDLLAVPGVTPEILSKLREFIVILPFETQVNANTASPPVLAAKIEGLTLANAATIVAQRERAYFRDEAGLSPYLPDDASAGNQLSFTTNYFIVNGSVRLGRGTLDMAALIRRDGGNGGNAQTTLVWMREN